MALRIVGPPDEDQADELEQDQELGRPLTRGVWVAGLVAAGAVLACMYAGGAAPKIPGIGQVLGFIVGFLLVLALFTGVMTAASWLLRYRHREMGAWSWKHGKRAAHWGYRHGRRHGGRLLGWTAAQAMTRWQAWRVGREDDEEPIWSEDLEPPRRRVPADGPEPARSVPVEPDPASPPSPAAAPAAAATEREEPPMSTPAATAAPRAAATTRTSGRKV